MHKVNSRMAKVSVNLADQDVKLLEEVANATGMTMSEVIRHALGLERIAHEVRQDSKKKLVLEEGDKRYLIDPKYALR